jgi:hypothetical protein
MGVTSFVFASGAHDRVFDTDHTVDSNPALRLTAISGLWEGGIEFNNLAIVMVEHFIERIFSEVTSDQNKIRYACNLVKNDFDEKKP